LAGGAGICIDARTAITVINLTAVAVHHHHHHHHHVNVRMHHCINVTGMTDQRSVLAGGAGICVDARTAITVINLTAVAVHHHHHVNVRMHHCITGMADQRSVLAGGAGICVDARTASL
jgi:hypothetical protein